MHVEWPGVDVLCGNGGPSDHEGVLIGSNESEPWPWSRLLLGSSGFHKLPPNLPQNGSTSLPCPGIVAIAVVAFTLQLSSISIAVVVMLPAHSPNVAIIIVAASVVAIGIVPDSLRLLEIKSWQAFQIPAV